MAITVNKAMDRHEFRRKFSRFIVSFCVDVDDAGDCHCVVPELEPAYQQFREHYDWQYLYVAIDTLDAEILDRIADERHLSPTALTRTYIDIQKAIEAGTSLYDDDTGEEIDDDDYTVVGARILSNSNLEANYFHCEHCGAWTPIDDFVEVTVNRWGDIEQWCHECADSLTWVCDDCGRTYSNNVDYEWVNYRQVCEVCLESEDYVRCADCGQIYWYEDLNEDGVCPMCADRREREGRRAYSIRDYHRPPAMIWFGEKSARALCYMGTGFELEIDKGNDPREAAKFIYDTLGEQVYFEHDGSLGCKGFEIISQPMTEKYMRKTFLPQIDEVFDKLVEEYGYRSHDTDTCGLHFHFSRELFGQGANRDRALEKFTLFFEDYWDDLVKFSRRTNDNLSWCRPYTGYMSQEDKEKDIKNMCKGKKYLSHSDRYHAVNLTNHNTVEVRLMRGTLNPDTFRACFDFLITLVKNSKKVKYTDRHNLVKWLNGLKPETIEYMKSRHAFTAYTATVA